MLLDLAERQRIDFGRMSILDLAEQFVAAMARLADRVTLEQRADWLVLATRLVLLRSCLLFPDSPESAAAAEQDAAAELRRLDDLAAMRAAGVWLQQRPQRWAGRSAPSRLARLFGRPLAAVHLRACSAWSSRSTATRAVTRQSPTPEHVPQRWKKRPHLQRFERNLLRQSEGALAPHIGEHRGVRQVVEINRPIALMIREAAENRGHAIGPMRRIVVDPAASCAGVRLTGPQQNSERSASAHQPSAC